MTLIATTNSDAALLLRHSIVIESLRKELRDLKQGVQAEIEKLQTREETLKCFSAKFCDEMEGIFLSTGELASREIAIDYTVCARYLELHYGRVNHYAYEVQEWLDK